jgi:hypothetical protein
VLDLTVGAHRSRIEEMFAINIDNADDRNTRCCASRKLEQSGVLVGNESWFEKEVLWRVTSNAELSERNEGAVLLLCASICLFELLKIRADCPDSRIELGEREPEVHMAKANDQPEEVA